MTTLVVSSVLLDILVDDSRFGNASETALKEASSKGRLVVCEVVVAELRPALSSAAELVDFCDDIGLEFKACSIEAALLAGTMVSILMSTLLLPFLLILSFVNPV